MPEIVFDTFGNRQDIELPPEVLAQEQAIADAYEASVIGLTNKIKSIFGQAVDEAAPLLAALPKESRRRHNALINEFLGASQRGDVEVALDILFEDIKPADAAEMETFVKVGKLFEPLPPLMQQLAQAIESEGAK